MTTRRLLIESAGKLLDDASVPINRRELEWLIQEADSCTRVDLLANLDARVGDLVEKRFFALVSRRLAREPVQYILGYTEFYGLRFDVNPSVLIPRPETELLVDYVLSKLKDMPNPIVVDVGTGSGCVAISVKHALPDTTVVGVDVSQAALDTAQFNAAELGADIVWMQADMYKSPLVAQLTDRVGLASVDIIVSNPPYVPPGERQSLAPEIVRYEPEVALFTGADETAPYAALARLGVEVLKESGFLVAEIHADHANTVRKTVSDAGFRSIQIHKDLAGRDRMMVARIRG